VAPSYAVLFKCHNWQAFEQRQLGRLKQLVGSGDVFVLIDDNRPPDEPIGHPAERTLPIGLSDALAIGLRHDGDAPVFWYSNDYPLHIFTRRFPHYQYYVSIEYDVVANLDFDGFIERLASDRVDFVAEPIRTPFSAWPWRQGCLEWYAPEQTRHWLTCLGIFSNQAAHHLYHRRVAASLRVTSGDKTQLPMCEAMIPTELHLAGFRSMQLNDFGSTAHFDTMPHYPEERLGDYGSDAFVHPILDRKRFLDKMFARVPTAEDLLDRNPYRSLMTNDIFAAALPLIHHKAWTERNDAICERVVEAMLDFAAPAYLRQHGLDGANLARGKQATQSSYSEWSVRPDEACGAVAGPVSGRFRFHTKREERPWWMVDLLCRHHVGDVWVFNRMDLPSRANGLEIFVSADGRHWNLAGVHHGNTPFGGADGSPLVVPVNAHARFVRVELPGTATLHLDQVQVLEHGTIDAAPVRT
jgi:hypothetical protein